MNKIFNSRDDLVPEMLEGYLYANPEMFERVANTNGLVLKEKKDKVTLITGGGAGNEPWNIGYVGYGLADGVALGHVYSAPPARSIVNVAKATNTENGVLFLATNHAGDVLNFELAAELLQLEGIRTKCLFVTDDLASAPVDKIEERRGVAGVAIVLKIAGAAADAGLDLDEVWRVSKKANDNIRTLSVTTSPGYMPGTGEPMFTMDDNMIEFGMGFNGEPGILKMNMQKADKICDIMMRYLLDDLKLTVGEEITVFVNGLGLTSLMELCIVNRSIKKILAEEKIRIHDMFIGTLFAPQGTGGFSISLLRLDQELKKFYNAPAYSPFFWKKGM
ncbi:MAG TPA: dihydroxyacetone kinase subunit DhaK [Bacillota bacterium]